MSASALVLAAAALAALLWGLWRLNRAVRRAARTDWGRPWLNWLDGFNRLFCQRFHRMPDTRLALPEQGPAVVAANHVSGLDPLLLIAAADRPLRFIIAREQYIRPCLHWLFRAVGCIPVDRTGRPERAMREALAALRAGEVVAIFPQGRIQLPDEPPRPLKGGVARLALALDCPIAPVRITGVRGAGQVLWSVFRRSRVRLEVHPPLRPEGRSGKELLQALQGLIH